MNNQRRVLRRCRPRLDLQFKVIILLALKKTDWVRRVWRRKVTKSQLQQTWQTNQQTLQALAEDPYSLHLAINYSLTRPFSNYL